MENKHINYCLIASLFLAIFYLFPSSAECKEKKPNLILITIDTLRADHLSVDLASDGAFVRVKDPAREYFDAEMHAASLRRIAEETDGRFYTPETVSTLPEDISFTDSGTTVIEHRDLWNMPAIFLFLIALVSGEWGYRRLRGLA